MRDRRELAGAWEAFQSHGFVTPPEPLRPLVSRYWWARWDLTGQDAYSQLIVPYPNVQLTFAPTGRPMVRGVCRGRTTRTLRGRSAVLGVAFRPGVFRRFLQMPVETITDQSLPAESLFGPDLPPLDVAALTEAPDPAPAVLELTETLNTFLAAREPPPDPVSDEVSRWVDEIAEDPALRRVDHLTARHNISERHLQRLFAEYVGASPKWVLRRYRLHEVTERMATRTPIDWAALAADLGYADQPHLTRDFTNMYGEPPTTYAARY